MKKQKEICTNTTGPAGGHQTKTLTYTRTKQRPYNKGTTPPKIHTKKHVKTQEGKKEKNEQRKHRR